MALADDLEDDVALDHRAQPSGRFSYESVDETRSISPLYRTPVVVDMQSGTFMIGA